MKKTSRQNSLTVFLVTVCLSVSVATVLMAEDRMGLADSKRIEMEKVVDAYIGSREAKSGMIDSSCNAVGESARLS